MKQLGNLAVVCAQRPDVLMQIYGSEVSVHVREGPERAVFSTKWDDDEAIQHIIRELKSPAIAALPVSGSCGRSHGSTPRDFTLKR